MLLGKLSMNVLSDWVALWKSLFLVLAPCKRLSLCIIVKQMNYNNNLVFAFQFEYDILLGEKVLLRLKLHCTCLLAGCLGLHSDSAGF